MGSNLAGADLSGTYLLAANLTGANLTDANLDHVVYDQATDWPVGFVAPGSHEPFPPGGYH
jgi:hypothetical protein